MYDHKQDNFGNKLITQMRYSLSLLVGQWIKSHDYPSPDEPPPKGTIEINPQIQPFSPTSLYL